MTINQGISFGLLTFLAIAQTAVADSSHIETRIQDLLEPETSSEIYKVFSTADGRVYDLLPTDQKLIADLKSARISGETVELALADDWVVGIRALPKAAQPQEDLFSEATQALSAVAQDSSYQPTVLSSLDSAKSLFDGLEYRLRRRSQCFQRAHVWATSMAYNRGVSSMKVFLFFTRKYIREHKFKWWFHVAPFVHVADGQSTKEYVLDRTFTAEPKDMQEWASQFMEGWTEFCAAVNSYAEYYSNQESAYCYLRKVPMYYYEPSVIEKADSTGTSVTSWNNSDLSDMKRAYSWWASSN